MLHKGQQAPGFNLYATPDQCLSLQELKGKKVILAFYPADFSPVCSDQMSLYNETLRIFEKYNATLLGISVDSRWCHMAYTKDRNLHFPLLADFNPKGEVARQYGVYNEREGQSERALFVLDEEGVVQWSYLSPVAVNPGADGILQALEAMSAHHPNKASHVKTNTSHR